MPDEPHLSNSAAWVEAEAAMIGWLNRERNLVLAPKKLALAGGLAVQVDGFSEHPLVLCEAYGRLGYVARTTVNKACTEAMKMIWLREHAYKGARLVLLIANEALEKKLTQGKGWVPEMLRSYGVEVIRADLDAEMQAVVHEAEERARQGMVPTPPPVDDAES